jgi:glycosyltransferase involved in cell wall biosynthesis
MTAPMPLVTVVINDSRESGGIARYMGWVVSALRRVADVDVVELGINPSGGSARQWAEAVTRVSRYVAKARPDLLVLGHTRFGPVAVTQLARRRPVVALAYGIEIWGASNRRIDFTLDLSDEIWPISTFTAREVKRRRPDARVGRVLGGGVERGFFVDEVGRSADEEDRPVRLLAVARIDDPAYKGLDTCVHAAVLAAQRTAVKLDIVGAGPAEHDLAAIVDTAGASEIVELRGAVDDETLRRLYARADLAVLLSRFERGIRARGEGLGIVPLEAGAAGTPAAVSDVGGTRDTVVEGSTGWLLPPGDAMSLSSVILELADDLSISTRMGANAKRFVREVHSEEPFAARIAEAVDRVVR